MDQAVARKLIQNEKDIITPAAKVEAELFEHSICPKCGSEGANKITLPPKVVVTDESVHVVRAPFSGSSPLVQGYAACRTCGTEYSPRTGIIIKNGDGDIQLPDIKSAPR
jgi:hypothetical protein